MDELTTNKTMTTKELAEAFGVDARTIHRTAEKIFDPATLMSRVINGGKSWVFTEAQATAIKIELQNHSKIAINGFSTFDIQNDLEMFLVQKKLDAYKDQRIAELTSKVEELAPKAETYDLCCSSERFKTIQDLGKITGIGANRMFARLVNDKIIYRAFVGGDSYYRSYAPYDHYFHPVIEQFYQNGKSKTHTKLLLTAEGYLHFCKKYGVQGATEWQ